jgi:hypothetical protein
MDNFSFTGKNCPQNIYLVKFTFPDDKITWGIDQFWCNFIDQIFLLFPRCVLIPLNVLWVNSVLGVNATNTHVWRNQLFLATETPKNVITLDVLTMAQLVSCFLGDSSWFFRSLWSISVWGAKVHLSRHIYLTDIKNTREIDHSWCTFGDRTLFIIFCVLFTVLNVLWELSVLAPKIPKTHQSCCSYHSRHQNHLRNGFFFMYIQWSILWLCFPDAFWKFNVFNGIWVIGTNRSIRTLVENTTREMGQFNYVTST